jgi:hypothetical protein
MEKIITSITKSYKFDGYLFVKVAENGTEKQYKRKAYTRTFGQFKGKTLFFLDDDVFAFDSKITEWEKGVQFTPEQYEIKNLGTYAEVFKKNPSEAKIPEADTQPAPMPVPEEKKFVYKESGEVFHEKFELIKTCIGENVPVYLAGPAGSGKNHTLEQAAKVLGLEFYFTNSVQQEYKITGFIDAGGVFHETEFYKAFTQGGLFFLDEMDASIPEVLVLLNAAIANKYFEFPNGKITAHEDFRVVAAGNTVGSGADELYTGRMVLDMATLDRFVIIEFGYSEKIEISLAKGNMELVEFVRALRKYASDNGIRTTFSYRCIITMMKLESAVDLKEVLKIAVFKGLDNDTIKTFKLYNMDENRYNKAFQQLLKA